MRKEDCFIDQLVRVNENTHLYKNGCREGRIYYIGEELVNVEFTYLATVAALNPKDIEPC